MRSRSQFRSFFECEKLFLEIAGISYGDKTYNIRREDKLIVATLEKICSRKEGLN